MKSHVPRLATFMAIAMSGAIGCGTGSGGGGFGCGFEREAAAPQPNASADRDFIALRDRFFVRTLELNPVTSTYLGGDGYSQELSDANGRLRDYSEDALAKELTFYSDTRRALHAIDRSKLPAELGIDYRLMDAQLGFMLHETGERKYYLRAVDTYVAEPFRGLDWQLQQMTDAGLGQLGTEQEWKLVISRLLAVPRYFETATVNLTAGKQAGNVPDRRLVQRDGIDGAVADANYFHDTLQKSAARFIGSRPFGSDVLPQLKQAGEQAAQAANRFAAFLKTTYDVNEKTNRYAAGTNEYEWRVHNALRDPRSAAELYEYGDRQVARYHALLEEVAQLIGEDAKLGLPFDTGPERVASVRAVFTYLSKESPKSDDELFRWYREAAARAVTYGRDRGMFDIPQEYKLDIVPTPQVLRGSVDAAYYPAPPFKKSGVGRFYLSPTGNDPGALKLNNRASIADTAVHEGFPGHDWHFKYMTQRASEISSIRWLTPGAVEDSSSMWSDSMASEGWALYAEELMAEPVADRPYGFYTRGEYLYELQGQMMRAVRVHVDAGIHTGRMTFDEARDYFTEHVYFHPGACASQEPIAQATCDTADRAIYRYSKWPTQAITYNLGKSAILSLRDAYKMKMGPAYSARTFHEQFMKVGTVPANYFNEIFLQLETRK